jgi:hypothetical protein
MTWRRRLSWEPSTPGWTVAVLFMIGSSLFALGSFPFYSQLVDPRAVGMTFVLGSIFFTSAAFGQLLESRGSADRRLVWASAVQFVGTILFNIDCIDALGDAFDAQQVNRLVWAPDVFGSIAFLVASHLAWLSVCGGLWAVRRDDRDWWSAALNYVGSIFFMASGIASYTLTTTDQEVNITIVNTGTCLGALCFLAGAYVLLPSVDPEPARVAS